MVTTSRADRAYSYIANEIAKGRWHAGEILSTYALAEEIGISRTPIAEALKRLESDGFVVIVPQVGCRVCERPDHQLITELSKICGALTGLAAESAALRVTADHLATIESTVEESERCRGGADARPLIDLTVRFYTEIVELGEMPRLQLVSRGMWSLLRHQLLGYPPLENGPASALQLESATHQRAVFRALVSGRSAEARELSERYIRDFSRRFAEGAQLPTRRTQASARTDNSVRVT